MAETPCILGQKQPEAGVSVDLFFVPPNSQVQCTIFVANQSSDIERVTISLIPNGSNPGTYNFIASNTPLSANACIAFSGIFLNSGDQVLVKNTFGKCSFTATGMLMA